LALIASIPPDTYRFEDSGLPLSQKYTYGMTAVPKDGIESDISAFATEAGIFPPLSLACRTAINNALFRREKINMISWQENPLNESGAVIRYNIYRRKSTQEDSEYQLIAFVEGNVLEYWDRKLPPGEKYYYVVTAVDPGGSESRASASARESS
jgi:fibronectin type 3 domain-containing protein